MSTCAPTTTSGAPSSPSGLFRGSSPLIGLGEKAAAEIPKTTAVAANHAKVRQRLLAIGSFLFSRRAPLRSSPMEIDLSSSVGSAGLAYPSDQEYQAYQCHQQAKKPYA